ncbi:type II toxin-antitoxin system death-on-curing family toxin [Komagataeibacter intermedius]|uniref:Death-on-curing protein n=2 Tax=Komagataeibacter intermedius TaxID=66229 RepID=A0A0N1N6U2_9PROT|nr:type II toxin-antitoxin system death-on-curing family toxin [Komagataeibacter intermedius]KPH87298.1 death-on-curing protein [Komagataeibacter intermedius AF2]MCF3637541.1 type II toxin-antitoxin system death-on-curing family toxin [Komagataeibacter intermedius]GAN86126.1 death-on-curing protein [Komagataeibacter intermedius TF2]GBQ79150.1 death on curing protein [Komagataeibacter intermedius NRIC 0521]
MPDLPEFLEPDAVVFMHDQALKEYGGTHGIKSEDLLRSALARAENRWHYAEVPPPDTATLAAAYAYVIARNHPFNDANKRTGWSCCVLFLRLNGICVQVSAPEAVDAMMALASGAMEGEAFAAWLRQHFQPQ